MEEPMNLTISYSEMRKHHKKNLDRVCSDHIPLLVARKNGESIVVISEDDFQSLQETAYLCRSPKNLSRLLEALDRRTGSSLEEVQNELGI
jgi:antitoxin YefM